MKGQKGGYGLMSLIIGGLIAAVVFGALLPTIADNTIGIANTGNISGATATLVTLVPLALSIGIVVLLFKKSGVHH